MDITFLGVQMTEIFNLSHHHPKWMPLKLHFAIEKCLVYTLYKVLDWTGDGIYGFSRRLYMLPTLIGGLNCNIKPCCIAWVLKLDLLDAPHTFAELEFMEENNYLPCPKCLNKIQ